MKKAIVVAFLLSLSLAHAGVLQESYKHIFKPIGHGLAKSGKFLKKVVI